MKYIFTALFASLLFCMCYANESSVDKKKLNAVEILNSSFEELIFIENKLIKENPRYAQLVHKYKNGTISESEKKESETILDKSMSEHFISKIKNLKNKNNYTLISFTNCGQLDCHMMVDIVNRIAKEMNLKAINLKFKEFPNYIIKNKGLKNDQTAVFWLDISKNPTKYSKVLSRLLENKMPIFLHYSTSKSNSLVNIDFEKERENKIKSAIGTAIYANEKIVTAGY